MKIDPQVFSDMYKDVFGVRPSYDLINAGWMDHEIDLLQKLSEEKMSEEARLEQVAREQFELQIEKMLRLGARNRSDAIRWLWQTVDPPHFEDFDYFAYQIGLSATDAHAYEEEMNNA